MKHIFKTLFVFLWLSSFNSTHAQNLDLSLASDSVQVNGGDNSLTCTFQILGNSLVWTQHVDGEEMPTGFTITSRTENWDSNTNQGLNVYEIVKDGIICRFTLSGEVAGMTGTLHSDLGDPESVQYIFNIHSINQL